MARHNWTKEDFELYISFLKESTTVSEARQKLFSKLKINVCTSFLNRQMDKYGYGPASNYIQGKEIDKIEDFNEKKFTDSKIEAKKKQLIKCAEERELAVLRKREAITRIIIDNLKGEIYRLPRPEIKIKKDNSVKKERPIDIMALVSDCQIGQIVNIKDVGGLNEYNFEIFQEELKKWKNEVISFVKRNKNIYPVNQLIIPFLGDIVEGHDIFSGQAYHLEMHVCKQVINAARAFSLALAEISNSFPELPIKIIGIPGNHGRVGRKGEAPQGCNWDTICYSFIEYELGNYKKENGGNIVFQWSEAWFQLFKSMGWVFCFIHGEDIKGWMGLPYYGVDRAKAKYMEMLNQYFTYFILGHHHKEAELPSDNGEKIINGNWVGGTDGSKIWIGSNNPNQWIFTINEKYGICNREKIYLKSRHESKPKIELYE